jgi:hypothetical protein
VNPSVPFEYTVNYGSVTITKYKGNAARVDIPALIVGRPVTAIGKEAFFDCTNLTSVAIPSSVTSIGNWAFSGTSLTSITVDSRNSAYASIDGVLFNKTIQTIIRYPQGKTGGTYTIPSSVTSIGNGAFFLTSLTSVTIPSSVTSIGHSAFSNCTSLASVTIPSSVTSIDSRAFYGCTSLTSVTIPSSVTSIGSEAFRGCTSLASVAIPSSVTSIGGWAFASWTARQTITIQGKANRAAADRAWGRAWRNDCEAKINYQR